MRVIYKNVSELISSTFRNFSADNASQLAAALAYYTIFSLSPILIIVLAVAGQFYNGDAARTQLLAQISSYTGPDTANFIDTILENSGRSTDGFVASGISFVVLLLGASGVFNQVQIALNKVWGVPPNLHRNLASNLKKRLRSFLMVLTLGILLLVFLIVSTLASYLTEFLNGGIQNALLIQIMNLILLFVILTTMFAMIFRIVPEKDISWTDVGLGAGITAFLFLIGRLGIGWYLFLSKSGSTYGVAGSLIVLLIWIYYSAQIFLLGAEFTQMYARKFGSCKNQEPSQSAVEKSA